MTFFKISLESVFEMGFKAQGWLISVFHMRSVKRIIHDN